MPTTKQRHLRAEVKRLRYGQCPECGRRVERRMTFWQSVIPNNRNEDGSRRTPEQIIDELNEQANAWRPDFTHDGCRRPSA